MTDLVASKRPLAPIDRDEDLKSSREVAVKAWIVVALLMIAAVCSFVDRYAFSLLIEPIKADFGISDAALGAMNGLAFGLFFAVAGLPMAWLADRWSAKGTIILGIMVWSIATAGCGLAGNFVALLLFCMAVGAGEAGLVPASYAIIYDRVPRAQLGRAISIFQIGGVLGAGGSLVIAGAVFGWVSGSGQGLPLIGDLAPWQQTFVIIALPGFLVALAICFMPKKPTTVGRPAAAQPAVQPDAGWFVKAPMLVTLFIGMSGVLATYSVMITWFPTVMVREFGWALTEVGRVYGTVLLVAAPIGMLLGGVLVDRLERRKVHGAHIKVLLAGAAGALPLALLVPFMTSAAALLALAAALHLVTAVSIGVAPALIQINAPASARSRIAAVYVLVVNIVGVGIAPTLVGYLSTRSGVPGGLRIAAVQVILAMLMLAVVLLYRLYRTQSREIAAS